MQQCLGNMDPIFLLFSICTLVWTRSCWGARLVWGAFQRCLDQTWVLGARSKSLLAGHWRESTNAWGWSWGGRGLGKTYWKENVPKDSVSSPGSKSDLWWHPTVRCRLEPGSIFDHRVKLNSRWKKQSKFEMVINYEDDNNGVLWPFRKLWQ